MHRFRGVNSLISDCCFFFIVVFFVEEKQRKMMELQEVKHVFFLASCIFWPLWDTPVLWASLSFLPSFLLLFLIHLLLLFSESVWTPVLIFSLFVKKYPCNYPWWSPQTTSSWSSCPSSSCQYKLNPGCLLRWLSLFFLPGFAMNSSPLLLIFHWTNFCPSRKPLYPGFLIIR